MLLVYAQIAFFHQLVSMDEAVQDSHAAELRAARGMFRWEVRVGIIAGSSGGSLCSDNQW